MKAQFDAMIQRGTIPCVETKEGVIYIQPSRDEKYFEYGGTCNTGMLIDGTVLYDNDFTFDENLQNCVDEIFERFGECAI